MNTKELSYDLKGLIPNEDLKKSIEIIQKVKTMDVSHKYYRELWRASNNYLSDTIDSRNYFYNCYYKNKSDYNFCRNYFIINSNIDVQKFIERTEKYI